MCSISMPPLYHSHMDAFIFRCHIYVYCTTKALFFQVFYKHALLNTGKMIGFPFIMINPVSKEIFLGSGLIDCIL